MKRRAINLLEEWADNGWTVNLGYLQSRQDVGLGWSCEVYETVQSPMPGAYVEGKGVTVEEAIENAAEQIAKARAATAAARGGEERA